MYIRRKVFSLTERLFGESGNQDKERKKFDWVSGLAGGGLLAAGQVGGGETAHAVDRILSRKALKGLIENHSGRDSKGNKLTTGLTKEEAKQLQDLINQRERSNADWKMIEQLLDKAEHLKEGDVENYYKLLKFIRENDKDLTIDDRLINRVKEGSGSYCSGRKNLIYIDTRDPSVLAHEYGHHIIKKGKAGWINKKIAEVNPFYNGIIGEKDYGKLIFHEGLVAAPGIATSATGFKVDDDTGDIKFRKASLIAPALASILAFGHTANEKLASKKGLEFLKKIGVSKEELERYKETLLGKNGFYDTYKSARTGKLAGIGVSTAGGYGFSGLMAKLKSDKIKENNQKKENPKL